MEIKRGIPVSPGIAIGPALILDPEGVRVPQRLIEACDVQAEVNRLHSALVAAARDARSSQQKVDHQLGRQFGAIFAAHAVLLEDAALEQEIVELIHKHHHAAEYAVSQVVRRAIKRFSDFGEQHFMASRVADLRDIERHILKHLSNQRRESLRHLHQQAIVLAHDLTPSETAELDPAFVHGFATESGGRTSHTAIMAGALQIPAVVGIGPFLDDLAGGELVIVDGNDGLLIIAPDPHTLARYQAARSELISLASQQHSQLRDLPACTRDGVVITLLGNIEFPHESQNCIEKGAAGVGLYRTEFLYLGRQTDPSEAEHFQAYMHVIHTMGAERPIVIRTLDLGADKFPPNRVSQYPERNPFLGLRSVRFCLRNLTLFKTQLRAILRASAFGNVRVMFPMVSTLLELRQCKMLLAEVKEDLDEEGIPFDRDLPVGTMIEVPSAAIMADQLAREVDFFSIGTNDLVQYTLAADRSNEQVASLYSAADPAVLKLIQQVVQAATRQRIEVNVCGEMSADPIFTLLLLGMGLRTLSITPHNIPVVKKVIRSVSLTDAERTAQEALQLETARDVTNFLREQTRRLVPDVLH
jgi:phosphotransferase system enzyme I (PtsI)